MRAKTIEVQHIQHGMMRSSLGHLSADGHVAIFGPKPFLAVAKQLPTTKLL